MGRFIDFLSEITFMEARSFTWKLGSNLSSRLELGLVLGLFVSWIFLGVIGLSILVEVLRDFLVEVLRDFLGGGSRCGACWAISCC